MKTLLLGILLLLASAMPFSAMAITQEEINQQTNQQLTNELANMTDAQKAEALKAIHSGSSSTAAKAQEWIDIGNGLGAGLASTAERLGIAVNKFAYTPVGRMAMVLIIWSFMGSTIIHFMAALFSLVLLFGWWRAYRRIHGSFNDKGKLIRLYFDHNSEATVLLTSAVGVIIAVLGFIALITA